MHNFTSEKMFWIGLEDRSDNGTYLWWPSRKTAVYSNWRCNSSERFASSSMQDCVVATTASGQGLVWHDRSCTEEADGYICQQGSGESWWLVRGVTVDYYYIESFVMMSQVHDFSIYFSIKYFVKFVVFGIRDLLCLYLASQSRPSLLLKVRVLWVGMFMKTSATACKMRPGHGRVPRRTAKAKVEH